jgi:N utilization substance protein A
MVNKDFFLALDMLEREKKVSKELLIELLEAGLASAYKKEWGESRSIAVKLNEEKQSIKVYVYRQVVDEVVDFDKEISLEEARQIKSSYKVGDVVIEDITPKDFSRIAAQTAKQVVLQRLNDAKRDMVVSEMNEKQGEILNAIVRRVESGNVYVEMVGSQMEGVMMLADQIPTEKYEVNSNIKVFLKKIRSTTHGAQVIVSRSAAGFVKRLFELEVPEIKAGLVTIKSIVREAGFRTKLAVASEDPNVDATGACIGNKGVRVNAVVAELGGEKVDVIEWCDDPFEYIARALSPAQVLMVRCIEETKTATVIVPDEKLSLAIGKNGQNARLAAKLTGWKIDVKPQSSLQSVIDSENAAEQENNDNGSQA